MTTSTTLLSLVQKYRDAYRGYISLPFHETEAFSEAYIHASTEDKLEALRLMYDTIEESYMDQDRFPEFLWRDLINVYFQDDSIKPLIFEMYTKHPADNEHGRGVMLTFLSYETPERLGTTEDAFHCFAYEQLNTLSPRTVSFLLNVVPWQDESVPLMTRLMELACEDTPEGQEIQNRLITFLDPYMWFQEWDPTHTDDEVSQHTRTWYLRMCSLMNSYDVSHHLFDLMAYHLRNAQDGDDSFGLPTSLITLTQAIFQQTPLERVKTYLGQNHSVVPKSVLFSFFPHDTQTQVCAHSAMKESPMACAMADLQALQKVVNDQYPQQQNAKPRMM